MAIYLTRQLTAASLQGIGAAFGGRNHATIVHACKRVEERANTEPEVDSDLRALRQQVLAEENDRSR